MQKKEAKDMTYQRIHKMCRIFGWIQILLMWFPKESGKPAHAVAFNPSLTCIICMLPSTVEGKKNPIQTIVQLLRTAKKLLWSKE